MLLLLVKMTKRGWPKQRLEVDEVGESRFLSRDQGMVTKKKIFKWGSIYILRVGSVDQVTLKPIDFGQHILGQKNFGNFSRNFGRYGKFWTTKNGDIYRRL